MKKLIFIIIIFSSLFTLGQDKVELLNRGNEQFIEGDFKKAEDLYKESLEKDNQYYKANLNLGHSLFRQGYLLTQKQDSTAIKKLEESEKFYENSIDLTSIEKEKAESYYNLGNTQLITNKIKESIESYKQSLRLVPQNIQTKKNLALAQYLLKKQNQDKDQQQNQEEENNKQKEEEEEEEEEEDNEQENSKQELSKEEIEQILNALEREEEDVQEDLQKTKGSGGKLLKDW